MDQRHRRRRSPIGLIGHPIVTLVVLLAIIALAGGSSRADSLGQVIVRAASAVALLFWTVFPPPPSVERLRPAFLFLALVAVVAAVQLVPLPPAIWTALPGRDFYAASSTAIGQPLPWRPIALVPSRGASALFALLVPLAVLVGLARCASRERAGLLIVLAALSLVSAVLGLAQLSLGSESGLRWYEYSSNSSAVGFFANRNHQALLLAVALPMLAAWAVTPERRPDRRRLRRYTAIGLGAFFILMLPTTGSRSGLAVAAIGLVAAAAIAAPAVRQALQNMRGARRRRLYAIAAGALVTFVAVLVFFGRNEAFVRLRDLDATGDLRARALPVVLQMARDAFPVGIGLGSFETVYRRFEPFDQLSYTYLNQAHNDLLQVVVEAGMLGGLLLVAFIGWWGWASWRAWREAPTAQSLAARAGSAVVLMILAASVTDYPVRTPLMLAVLTIACAWMLTVRPGARETVLEDPARDRS